MKRKLALICGVVIWVLIGNVAFAGDILATLHNGNTLAFPYCWKKGSEIRFDAPGGTVGLNTADVQSLEERIMHADIDAQYLISKATEGPASDPFSILKDFLSQKRGITIGEGRPAKQNIPSHKTSSQGDAQLIAPVTKLFDSYVQAFKSSKGGNILVGAFVNAREELEGRKCYVKLLDIEKKAIQRQALSIKRLNVSEEEQAKNKLSPLFYLIYGTFPVSQEFWAYDIVCDIVI